MYSISMANIETIPGFPSLRLVLWLDAYKVIGTVCKDLVPLENRTTHQQQFKKRWHLVNVTSGELEPSRTYLQKSICHAGHCMD